MENKEERRRLDILDLVRTEARVPSASYSLRAELLDVDVWIDVADVWDDEDDSCTILFVTCIPYDGRAPYMADRDIKVTDGRILKGLSDAVDLANKTIEKYGL